MSQLNKETLQNLDKILQNSIANPKNDLPGASVYIANAEGKTLFNSTKGYTDANLNEPLTEEHIQWIASTTKIITSIAVLQLVEQGKLDLDDPEVITKYAPDLDKLPIISAGEDDSVKLSQRKNEITLRKLLTHTSGLSYAFSHPLLAKFEEFFSLPFLSSRQSFKLPLIFEPGTAWAYSVGIDWAGFIVEKFTGLKLQDYFDEFIFKPLGVKNASFYPNEDLFKKLIDISSRDEKGDLNVVDLTKKRFKGFTPETLVQSGGGGIYASPSEYVKILIALLNNGLSPLTNERILKKETVDLIFTNQIPEFPNFLRGDFTKNQLPDLEDSTNFFYPEKGALPQGWGLSLFVNLHNLETGRSAYSGSWSGAANWFYWIDRAKGVTGLVTTQIFPPNDKKSFQLWKDVETEVYKGLQQ